MKTPHVKAHKKRVKRKPGSIRGAFTLNDVLAGDIVGRKELRTPAPILARIKAKYRAAS